MQQQQDDEHHALCLDGVVENVLRFLTQKARFSCSLVSSRWHAAAVAVTAEAGLLLSPCSSKAEQWLVKYGAELQALVVRNGSLCGSGDTSSVAGLQQLTRLELSSVTSRTGLLRAIGDSMKELRHLGLVNLCWGPLISTSSRDELSAAASRLWEGCSMLTYLQAEQCDLNDNCVTSLCKSLPHLLTLDLSRNSLSDAHSLGVLPSGLTSLCLGGNSEYLDVTVLLSPPNRTAGSSSGSRSRSGAACAQQQQQARSRSPGRTGSSADGCAGSSGASSSCLPALRALDINSLTLRQPEVLSELTALTWLNVDDIAMPEPSDLLGALPKLLQLQQLNMMGCLGGGHPPVTITALRAALQPLTCLTALDIGNNSFSSRIGTADSEPAGLFDRLLLPLLQVLGVSDMCWHGIGEPLFRPLDVMQLARACPKLAWLRMHRSVALSRLLPRDAPGSGDLDGLVALKSCLTRLDFDGEQDITNAHMYAMSRLAALVCLEVSGVGKEISDHGLLALTALTGLTHLRVADITSDDVSLELLPKRGRGHHRAPPGDSLVLQPKLSKHGRMVATVSQQLKETCDRSPQLWKDLQQQLKDELRVAKKDAKDARKEAASERKKASTAQKQARKAQKQAAAAQDEVTALRQQLEALQSQLQHSQSQ